MDYQQLVNEQAAAMGVAPLPVESTESVQNAQTDGASIKFNPSWFSPVESQIGENGVRFILSHELGHAHGGMIGGHDGELDADRFAARAMSAQGAHPDSFIGVMGFLNPNVTPSHPASGTRKIEALRAHANEEQLNGERAATGQRTAQARSAR